MAQEVTEAGNPTANYNVLSENLRRVTPSGIQCAIFCGGRRCKYESPDNWDTTHMAIHGIFSHWVTDDILAMARPSTEVIVKENIIQQFQSAGIRSIINLQKPGEHASCGNILETSGFTYDPNVFMENNIYFYNFTWKDYGEATTSNLLDMVKVMAFALEEGKVAVHCHAGLGRTGVLIACYLVYSLRVKANDAIRFVRLKRPNAIQTRGQILCVQDFEQFIHPQSTVFCNKELSKDKKAPEFTLTQYLQRQALMLHGYEMRTFKFIPKVVHVLCERILQLCDCNRFGLLNIRSYLAARRMSSPGGSTLVSGSSTRRTSTELDDLPGNFTDDDVMAASPSSDQAISPDMPSCASGMSGLDDSCLDAMLGDGIHGQQLHENVCYQELSSQVDLQKAAEDEKIIPYNIEDVVRALLADHDLLGEGTKKYMKQYRIELNVKQSTWARLKVERNLYVLTGLLYEWMEHLKTPILTRDDLSYIVIFGMKPGICLKKLDMATQYTLEYLLRVVVVLQPLPRNVTEDLVKRFLASLTHQGVPIEGVLKPSGKGYRKLREGTYKRVLEFLMKLFDVIHENMNPRIPPLTPEASEEIEQPEQERA
ncbi:protein tyrosine phosphatase domain-containing protein 1 [Anabrus simplex]|uniref:protein tyrosine phosphatase domain-containing protein 1 n=1 Tax=Anabrus simplex TaxID=316456 RepID=UPI0035A359AC